MVFPDIRNLGEVIFNGLLYSSATFATHPHDEASATAPAHEPLLYARAVVTSSSMCAASLPKSCSYLDSNLSVLLLATIPYVCMADIKTLSPTLYTTVEKSCPLNFLEPGSKLLACLKAGMVTTPVSTTCSKSSTSSAKSSTTKAGTTVSTSSQSAAITSKSSQSSSSSFLSQSSTKASAIAVASEAVNSTNYVRQGADPVAQKNVIVDGTPILTNTSVATNTTVVVDVDVTGTSTSSTILVIARDFASSYSAYSGLNGYGIPFEVLLVPQNGTTLPILNSSALIGNYGGIVILSEVSYDYGASIGFQSALTQVQWLSLYTYQQAFGVRMVRMDVFPSADSGTLAQGGCCGTGVEQLVSISDTTQFPTAGLKVGATMSTIGLYHYPATITNSTIATPFVEFAPTTGYPTTSTAGVINNISGRQQMVFFMSFATDWSPTSNLLQHAWIHWVTRGLYVGFRRTYLGTQVDDMFLESDIYYPGNTTFRVRTTDMDAIKTWIPTVNAKMNKGSTYFMEIGHNGNGNIGVATSLDTTGKLCSDGPITYESANGTSLEFQKALGSGTNVWPATPTAYPYSVACTNGDPLRVWWTTAANRDAFAHVSHTFTHQSENNATYSDIFNEISWNVAWMKQITLSSAKYFSANGLIPPAITGLHNGDALSAWAKNGITNAVGDNTRPVLMNKINEHWPLLTTVEANGFGGMQITPRWATNIYYNCDTTDCTVQEWIKTSAGKGTILELLDFERVITSRHLLGLHHDPFMFHQANLRQADVSSTVVNGVSQQLSLIQMWVETVAVEMSRIVNWPLISIKHDDISAAFSQRMTRDACKPKMTYQLDLTKQAITGVQVTTLGNTCTVPIPVTLPGPVTNTQGFTTEQVGNDPLTIWVKMSGSAVKFTLTTAVPW